SAEEHIPGLEAIDHADLLITMIRRMTLPPEELGRIKKYFDAGRPLVGLRNTCHAFENWPEFVHDVLGGNYRFPPYQEPETAVAHVHPPSRGDPLLAGVPDEFATGWRLYKTLPLAPASKLLLVGTGPKLDGPPEPIAWTHAYRGGRIFFASLGHPTD